MVRSTDFNFYFHPPMIISGRAESLRSFFLLAQLNLKGRLFNKSLVFQSGFPRSSPSRRKYFISRPLPTVPRKGILFSSRSNPEDRKGQSRPFGASFSPRGRSPGPNRRSTPLTQLSSSTSGVHLKETPEWIGDSLRVDSQEAPQVLPFFCRSRFAFSPLGTSSKQLGDSSKAEGVRSTLLPPFQRLQSL